MQISPAPIIQKDKHKNKESSKKLSTCIYNFHYKDNMLAVVLQVSYRNPGRCGTQLEYHDTKWFQKLYFIRHKSLFLSLLVKIYICTLQFCFSHCDSFLGVPVNAK